MCTASRVLPPPLAPTKITEEPGLTLIGVSPLGLGMEKSKGTRFRSKQSYVDNGQAH